MNIKRHKASTTEIRYDNLFREEDEFISKGFKTTKEKRYQFQGQDKLQFQDGEDIADELSHLRLVGNLKNVTGALEITLKEVGEKIKEKKKRVKLRFFDEERKEDEEEEEEDDDDDVADNISLKKIVSKVRFIKNAKTNDTVFKNFHKLEYKPLMNIIKLPENYKPIFKLQDTLQTYARNSLSSKFTTTSTTTHIEMVAPAPRKVIKQITIDPTILKRLGIK